VTDQSPRKYYVYFIVTHEPKGQRVLYIGKGTGDRDKRHLNYARLGYKAPLWQAIRDRWFLGYKVEAIRVETDLTESAALLAEKFWIDHHGRATLYNAVLGGTTNGALVTRGQKRRPIKPKE
jgi:hypothetical protein